MNERLRGVADHCNDTGDNGFFDNSIDIEHVSKETGVPKHYLLKLFTSRWFLRWYLTECLISKETLAEKLDVSVSFINKLMRHEGLPYFKIGKLVRFRVNEVAPWLTKRSYP